MEEFAAKYGFNSLKPRLARWVEEQCKKVYPEAAPAKEETKDYRLAADGKTLAEWRRLIEEKGAFAFKVLADGINRF